MYIRQNVVDFTKSGTWSIGRWIVKSFTVCNTFRVVKLHFFLRFLHFTALPSWKMNKDKSVKKSRESRSISASWNFLRRRKPAATQKQTFYVSAEKQTEKNCWSANKIKRNRILSPVAYRCVIFTTITSLLHIWQIILFFFFGANKEHCVTCTLDESDGIRRL